MIPFRGGARTRDVGMTREAGCRRGVKEDPSDEEQSASSIDPCCRRWWVLNSVPVGVAEAHFFAPAETISVHVFGAAGAG